MNKCNHTTAVFPGSFDPFTIGHYDILLSALKIFDKVIIAVGNNMMKKGYFSPETRKRIIEAETEGLVKSGFQIETVIYSGLTADLCRELHTDFIIRGIRTSADFENETIIANANKKLVPSLSTVFFPADCNHSFISSTVVRDVLVHGGDISHFLPEHFDIKPYIISKDHD